MIMSTRNLFSHDNYNDKIIKNTENTLLKIYRIISFTHIQYDFLVETERISINKSRQDLQLLCIF